jgi:outer membrane immunogenic protein
MKSFKIAASLVLLSTTVAIAADLPSIKSVPAFPASRWTGFYAGLNAGGTWSVENSVNLSTAPITLANTGSTSDIQASNYQNALYDWALPSALGVTNLLYPLYGGFIGGGQLGYNLQSSFNDISIVTGIEVDIQGIASANGNSSATRFTTVGNASFSYSSGAAIATTTQVSKYMDYLGTARARLGYIAAPTLLLYGTAGLAYGGVNINSSVSSYAPSISSSSDLTHAWGSSGSYSNTQVGWIAGGGIEWMFLPSWSLKTEYLYYDLGSVTFNQELSGALSTANSTTPGDYYAGQLWWGNVSQVSSHFSGNIVRAGVNYHFNFGKETPIIAKY